MCINNGIKQCNDCRFLRSAYGGESMAHIDVIWAIQRKGWLSKHVKAF